MNVAYFAVRKTPPMMFSGGSSRKSGQKKSIQDLRKKHGQFWREAREPARLTQQEVAAVLGYKSGQFISNVESGRCRFPESQLPKLQKLYALKAAAILEVVLEEEEWALRQAFGLD